MQRLRRIALAAIILLTPFAIADEPSRELTEGQQKIKELSFMVGEWEVTAQDGRVFPMSIRLINNNSFLELVGENGRDYREITRWDLAEKRFTSNAFGQHGGHGTFYWSKVGDNAWKLHGKTPYYWASGTTAEVNLTLTSADKDTMTFAGSIGDLKLNNTARRVAVRRPSRRPRKTGGSFGKEIGIASLNGRSMVRPRSQNTIGHAKPAETPALPMVQPEMATRRQPRGCPTELLLSKSATVARPVGKLSLAPVTIQHSTQVARDA